ncbi:hypothetical protein I4131_12350 [Staphylococcus aureus]|nr:hypothetical protein [Staphylococcus aureus]
MAIELVNLYVITIDEHDIFGNYNEDELKDAMKELYISLKNELDKHYTVEEQMEYHYEDLLKLYEMTKQLDIEITNIKQFLTLYNELTPNYYEVKTVEIESADEALAIELICNYGLKNFKSNFNILELRFYQDDKIISVKQLSQFELKEYLYKFIYDEVNNIRNDYNGCDILNLKFDYLTKLKDRQYQLDNGINELLVLNNLIDDYNYEYQHTVKEIKIDK